MTNKHIPNSILSMWVGRWFDIIAPTTAPITAGMNKLFNGVLSNKCSLLRIIVAATVRKNIVVSDNVIASCIFRFMIITKNGTMSKPQPIPKNIAIIPIRIPIKMMSNHSFENSMPCNPI